MPLPVYKKVLVCPPTTISIPSTSLAIILSVVNPAWPTAMRILILESFARISDTACLTDVIISLKIRFPVFPEIIKGKKNVFSRSTAPHS